MASQTLEDLLQAIEAALDAGRPDEALLLAEQAGRLDRDSPDVAFLKGEALLELGRAEEALTAYQEAERLLPGDPAILCGMGLALFDRVRLDQAEQRFVQALRGNPDLAEAHHHLGVLYERQGKDRLAERHFKQATRLAPDAYPRPVRMSREEFDACVSAALEELPDPVRRALQNTPVVVEPFPSEAVLKDGEPPLSPDLLGLCRGFSLMDRSTQNPWSELPGEITLYQNNLERMAATRDELVEQIRITVLHEVGHVLGLDEEDLDERGLT